MILLLRDRFIEIHRHVDMAVGNYVYEIRNCFISQPYLRFARNVCTL